jgi:hypothetical protein
LPAAQWIPAFAGMTKEKAGMTNDDWIAASPGFAALCRGSSQ